MKDKRISEREFGLNLNLDDSLKVLSFGDARFILNCWSGINREESIGAVENEKGNVLISFTLPSGSNTSLGSTSDEINNAIIFFVFNEFGNHCILRYNINDQDITKVLFEESVLNFTKSGRTGYINDADVVDGKLYWTDGGFNEARKINIDKAINFTAGNPGGYTVLNEETITAIKRPPRVVTELTNFTDTTRNVNFIARKSFQFAYRYVYDDFERSVFSPISRNIVQPFDPMLADDVYETNRLFSFNAYTTDNHAPFSSYQVAYNGIRVGVALGSEIVTNIEVAVRDSETDDWNIIEIVDNTEALLSLSPGNIFNFNFYNDRSGITVSDEAINKSQDFFPIKPKHQEYTHLNLLTYGNYKDGYDLEDIDASVVIKSTPFDSLVHYFTTTGTSTSGSNDKWLTDYTVTKVGSLFIIEAPLASTLSEGDLLMFGTEFTTLGGKFTHTPAAWYRVRDIDPTSQAIFTNGVIESLILQGYTTSLNTAGDFELLKEKAVPDIDILQRYEEGDWNKSTLKSGAFHRWAIVYYDDFGRHGPAQSIDSLQAYVPMWGETSGSLPSTNGFTHTAEISINNTPPVWAKYYQLVYSGALNIGDFLQFHYKDAKDDAGNPLNTRIDFNEWVNYTTIKDRIHKNFSFEVGDFVREVKNGKLQGSSNFLLNQLSANVKSEIINRIYIAELQETPSAKAPFNDLITKNGGRSLIEQYKPTVTQNEQIYFGAGKVFPILISGNNRFHGGDTNQTSSTPAIINFNIGDAWTRQRPFFTFAETFLADYPHTHTVEDPDYSDYYPSASKGYGRPFGENEDFEQIDEINGIRHTGTYLQGSRENNLNSIDFDAVTYVNIHHGEITGMNEIGFTLKVLQIRKLNSIFLGRQVTTNPQGTQDIILSDNVFSSITPSELDYGCSHPESVVKHDRHLYFWDVNYGKVLRDAPNGIEVISDYKVASQFKDLSERIQKNTDGLVFCYGGWNDEIHSYIFTYLDGVPNPGTGGGNGSMFEGGPDESFTISFQEITNRWKSFHSYISEGMEFLGREFVSFKEGAIWRHNVNALRCNYYGVQFTAVMTPISNIEPDAVKSFHAISLHVNKKPQLVEMIIPPNDQDASGMYSRLQSENLRFIEGNLYSALKRDIFTPGMGNDSIIKRLNNGRRLRGNVCEFRITFDTTDEIVVTRLIVEAEHSLMSG